MGQLFRFLADPCSDIAGAAITIFSSAVREPVTKQKEKFAAIASIEHGRYLTIGANVKLMDIIDNSFDSGVKAEIWKEVDAALCHDDYATKEIAHITVLALAQQVKIYIGREDAPQISQKNVSFQKGLSTQNTSLITSTILSTCKLVQLSKARERTLFKGLMPGLTPTIEGSPSVPGAPKLPAKVNSDITGYDHTIQLSPEQMKQIFLLDSDSLEIRDAVTSSLVCLLASDALPSDYVTSSTQKILWFCQDTYEVVQNQALMAISLLAKRDRGRGTSSILNSMFTMMSASALEEDTLVIVVDHILENSVVRESLSVGATTDEVVLSKLKSPSSLTKRAALSVIGAFLKNPELCASIARDKKIFDKIGTFLMHSDADIQEAALKAIFASLPSKNDLVINALANEETMFKLLAKLGSNEQSLRERAFTCLLKIFLTLTCSADVVKEILLTKKCILHLFEMLHGKDGDQKVLSLVDELVKGLGGLFGYLQHGLRDNYPFRDYNVSPDDTAQLGSFLSSSNSAIVIRAGVLIQHFAHSDNENWAKLLQTDDANLVVKILTEFANFLGPERLKIPHVSGIMAQLLSMTKAHVNDFGRWQPGFEGLIALGVFSSDEVHRTRTEDSSDRGSRESRNQDGEATNEHSDRESGEPRNADL
ncbi:hypothetical protein R3P38DRAFT_2805613 [Favolaschia claudopus]|uniref:Uncharacterized protein n=1 Tax=Favolaschia claudopus TaxID=2862362 RepID=A0AAV9ZMP9_9AGAR